MAPALVAFKNRGQSYRKSVSAVWVQVVSAPRCAHFVHLNRESIPLALCTLSWVFRNNFLSCEASLKQNIYFCVLTIRTDVFCPSLGVVQMARWELGLKGWGLKKDRVLLFPHSTPYKQVYNWYSYISATSFQISFASLCPAFVCLLPNWSYLINILKHAHMKVTLQHYSDSWPSVGFKTTLRNGS